MHGDIAQPVLKDYLARGQVPSAEQLRADLKLAYQQGGVKAPSDQALTTRINATRELMEVVKDAPPEIKQKALDTIRNSSRYLAVPAAVGVGAAMTPDDY